MSEAYLSQSLAWAELLVRRERANGAPDAEKARRAVARKAGIPYAALWALKFRPPKDPVKIRGLFEILRDAYARECERQVKCLEQEIEITRAIAGADHRAVRAAEALVGKTNKERVAE